MASSEEELSEDRSHDNPRPIKRSHTEALDIYGKCFRISKNPPPSVRRASCRCPLHKKYINFAKVVVGETVQVIRCRHDDRCYNEMSLVVVEFMNRSGEVTHLPIDCIDVNHPLEYKCFLCNISNLGSDFDKARSHLTESHFMSSVMSSKRQKKMLLLQYPSLEEIKKMDFARLRQELVQEQEDNDILNEKYLSLEKAKVEALASHNDAVIKLQRINRGLRYTHDELKKANTNLQAEKSTLMAEKTKLMNEHSSLEETKNKEVASLDDKVKKQAKSFSEQRDQLIKENSSLDMAVANLRWSKHELEQSLNTTTDEIRYLNDELDKHVNAKQKIEEIISGFISIE
jgi:hypothetical protein